MLNYIDEKSFKKQLKRLDDRRRLFFGALCCERIINYYVFFQKKTGWGDYSALRKTLDFVWDFVEKGKADLNEARDLLTICEKNVPDSDDFSTIYCDYGQNAAIAICYLVQYLTEKDLQSLVWSRRNVIDLIDLRVQEALNLDPNDPHIEEMILSHKKMQQELSRQLEDFKIISEMKTIDASTISKLKGVSIGKNAVDI